MKRIFSIIFLPLVFGLNICSATTVVPPSFSELVSEADTIVIATVSAVRSRWDDTPYGPVIRTYVTIEVIKTLKGASVERHVLRFLGGTVGDETLTVEGTPKFVVGGREILFLQRNGVQACPLVARGHGRYRVLTDHLMGRDYIARDDGLPFAGADDVPLPQGASVLSRFRSVASALSPTEFGTQISLEHARHETK